VANVQPYLARLTARRNDDGWRWNQFLFSFALVEKTVHLELQRRIEMEQLYHQRADFVYEEYDVSERQQEFQKLDWSFFCQLRIPERIAAQVEKFPIIGAQVKRIAVCLAAQKRDQTADLFFNGDVKHVLVSICPETLANWDLGRKHVLHELMYVADMLDPSFAYEKRKLGTCPSDEEIIRQRFALLWQIYIGGRLEQRDETPVLSLAEYEREFNRLFRRIPIDQHGKLLEKLWSGNHVTYKHLVGFARDLSELARWGGVSMGMTSEHNSSLSRSSFCPICHCRMYRAAQFDEGSNSIVVDRIQREFPNWSPDQGICERCVEYCELQ
jgi:hypothetical protein